MPLQKKRTFKNKIFQLAYLHNQQLQGHNHSTYSVTTCVLILKRANCSSVDIIPSIDRLRDGLLQLLLCTAEVTNCKISAFHTIM